MFGMVVTWTVFQPPMAWLKAVAWLKTRVMSVTLAVFQPPMS
jgi:hypothetical protein